MQNAFMNSCESWLPLQTACTVAVIIYLLCVMFLYSDSCLQKFALACHEICQNLSHHPPTIEVLRRETRWGSSEKLASKKKRHSSLRQVEHGICFPKAERVTYTVYTLCLCMSLFVSKDDPLCIGLLLQIASYWRVRSFASKASATLGLAEM